MDQKEKIQIVKDKIFEISKKKINIMEVCGTHTMSLARHAIRTMLPETVNLISGPGCPVCVTDASDIQAALDIAKKGDDFMVATFGDMLKVPSQGDSLQNYKNVLVIYSPMDAIEYAKENPDKNVVLVGIGFETTTPLIASTIQSAAAENLENFSVLSMHKTLPIALTAILESPDCDLDGLLLPGHVSAITGKNYYEFMEGKEISAVISGFDPLQMMEAIYLLVKYAEAGEHKITNNYPKLVTDEGNKLAMDTMFEVFEAEDVSWRGIGVIPGTGLKIKEKYKKFDAKIRFEIPHQEIEDAPGCLCGAILMGKAAPTDCKYFAKGCTPSNPVGPCMVSSEGTCAAFFKYNLG